MSGYVDFPPPQKLILPINWTRNDKEPLCRWPIPCPQTFFLFFRRTLQPQPQPQALAAKKFPVIFIFIRALDNRWGVLKTFFICFAANYNWVPEKARLHASSYLVDLLDYLQTTFLNFTTLPVSWPSPSCFLGKTWFHIIVHQSFLKSVPVMETMPGFREATIVSPHLLLLKAMSRYLLCNLPCCQKLCHAICHVFKS